MNWNRVLRLLAQRSLAQMLAYRLSALFVILFGSLFAAAEVVSILVYYQYAPDIAGWDLHSFLALAASYGLIQYIYQFCFVQSHEELMDRIIEGDLDYDLIRPLDAQFLCSLKTLDYPSLVNLMIPIGLLVYSWPHLGVPFAVGTVLLYAALVVCGVALYYLLSQFFVTLAFWVERPQKLGGVTEYLFDFASRPRAVYPRAMQFALSFVLPVLTAVNMPADFLRGQFDLPAFVVFAGMLVALWAAVRAQWRLGLRRYASAN